MSSSSKEPEGTPSSSSPPAASMLKPHFASDGLPFTNSSQYSVTQPTPTASSCEIETTPFDPHEEFEDAVFEQSEEPSKIVLPNKKAMDEETLLVEMYKSMKEMRQDVQELVKEMRQGIQELKTGVQELKTGVQELRNDVKGILNKLYVLRLDVSMVCELGARTLLKAFVENKYGASLEVPFARRLSYTPIRKLEEMVSLCLYSEEKERTPRYAEIDCYAGFKVNGGVFVAEVTRFPVCRKGSKYVHPTKPTWDESTKLLYKMIQLERAIRATEEHGHKVKGAALAAIKFRKLQDEKDGRDLMEAVLKHWSFNSSNDKYKSALWLTAVMSIPVAMGPNWESMAAAAHKKDVAPSQQEIDPENRARVSSMSSQEISDAHRIKPCYSKRREDANSCSSERARTECESGGRRHDERMDRDILAWMRHRHARRFRRRRSFCTGLHHLGGRITFTKHGRLAPLSQMLLVASKTEEMTCNQNSLRQATDYPQSTPATYNHFGSFASWTRTSC
ncbi:hypothetical protein SELMODRAFT_407166 [Selaginella moellendorffii]|uniref:Uncharacterized protein n=1 Tax=Selaginella moellendorffii TaxID=88036 RepID=D8R444_SELML|nr:hypothetical protein SELMODRAFT_407166 [Selaginella moellendorffii]